MPSALHRVELVVSGNKQPERMDVFLARELPQSSRSQIQKWIKDGLVRINDKPIKSHHLVQPRETIVIDVPGPPPQKAEPEDIPLNIVYEDEWLLVVDKPAGMVVHPAYGHHHGTLVNALLGHASALSTLNGPGRAGIVHRIDKDTSGLLVAAKTDLVHRDLARQFEKKTALREYQALVWGHFQSKTGVIETLLSRSVKDRRKFVVAKTGKNAVTHFEVQTEFPIVSFLRLRLGTGRTHQIRVHLAHIGHPVFGDRTYGGGPGRIPSLPQREAALAADWLDRMPRQALHAKTLGFLHPGTGETVFFDSELPEDMAELLARISTTVNL
jgi:23S rRNA pseudouridine1911/1915/1917 synthase